MSEHRYEVGGAAPGETSHTVRVEPHREGGLEVRVGDRSHRVEVGRSGGALLGLAIDGRRLTAHVARADDGTRLVNLRGRIFRFAPPARQGAGRRSAGGEAGLAASMPAMVVSVLTAPGEEVALGQVLLVLEAMRMTHEIKAPFAGRVAEVRCVAGGIVEPGVPLVRIDRAEEAP